MVLPTVPMTLPDREPGVDSGWQTNLRFVEHNEQESQDTLAGSRAGCSDPRPGF